MTPDRWKRIEEIYHFARGRAPADRAGYLAEACRDDEELRREIESLLVNGEILSKLESRVTCISVPTALSTSMMLYEGGHRNPSRGRIFSARSSPGSITISGRFRKKQVRSEHFRRGSAP